MARFGANSIERSNVPGRVLVLLLQAYKRLLSPLLPPACRFYPTCSEYAAQAIAKHGLLRGVSLAARRLARCHPFNPGGVDLVPEPTALKGDRCT